MKPELPDCVCAFPVPSHDAVRHNASALFDARLLLSDRSIDTFSRSRMDGMVRKERKRERENPGEGAERDLGKGIRDRL